MLLPAYLLPGDVWCVELFVQLCCSTVCIDMLHYMYDICCIFVWLLHLCVVLTRCFVVETPGGPLRKGVGGCEGVRADATGYPGGNAVSETSQHRHGKATRTRSTPKTRWYEKQINCSPSPALLCYTLEDCPATANRR